MISPWSGQSINTLLSLSSPEQHTVLCHDQHVLFVKEGPDRQGYIYLAQVRTHWPERKAYLVSLGEEDAFLPEKHCTRVLCIGEKIIVQLHRMPVEHKHAIVSMSIRLRGQCITLYPQSKYHAFSPALSPEECARCLRHEQHINMQYGIQWHRSIRNFDENHWISDILRQVRIWHDIETYAQHNRLGHISPIDPTLHAWQQLPWSQIHTAYLPPHIITSYTDYCKQGYLSEPKQWHMKTLTHSMLHAYLEQLLIFTTNKIVLPEGAQLHIDETSVAQLIDIDSLKSSDSNDHINTSVVPYIAQAIALRNLSGTIIIDVLDTHQTLKREKLRARYREYLQSIPTPVHMISWDQQWLKLHRHKRSTSLQTQWAKFCPSCQKMHSPLPTKILCLQQALLIETQLYDDQYQHLELSSVLYRYWTEYYCHFMAKPHINTTYAHNDQLSTVAFRLHQQTRQDYMMRAHEQASSA